MFNLTSLTGERHRISPLKVALFAVVVMLAIILRPHSAAAAACTAPTTDYGTVSGLSVNIPTAGSYRVFSRMVGVTASDSYLLEVDGSSCATVGGAGVATYTTAQDTANTRFSTSATDSTNWISTTNTGAHVDLTLTAGAHTFKLIGNSAGVVVDMVIFSQIQTDGTYCIPQGTGTNCTTAATDTTPPVASITSPAASAVVNGTVAVTVSASDNVAVTGVDIYDGATKLGSATLSSGSSASGVWTYSWNASAATAGSSHVLTAHVTDGTNPIVSGSVTVTIKDTTAPTVSITSPTAGTSVSGTFTATATAADNIGVNKVEFYIDNVLNTTSGSTSSPYSGSVNVTAVTAGAHNLTAKAYDAAGNVTTSAAISITVTTAGGGDTTPPTVTVTTPPSGAILSDDINVANFNSSAYVLTATASDASGIKNVVFKIDGTAVGAADTTSPYTATLNLTTLTCGTHTITATATDNSTNANVATATTTFTATYGADITATPDCHVTYLDLSVLASKYNQTTNLGRADINQDGIVNYLDLSALASKYGQ